MDVHRYGEQVEALKKYKDYAEIPPDPYDIDASLAKQMLAHYDDQLMPEYLETAVRAMDEKKLDVYGCLLMTLENGEYSPLTSACTLSSVTHQIELKRPNMA